MKTTPTLIALQERRDSITRALMTEPPGLARAALTLRLATVERQLQRRRALRAAWAVSKEVR